MRRLSIPTLAVRVFGASTLIHGAVGFLIHYSRPADYAFLMLDFDDLVSFFGMSDPGAYLLGGKALAEGDLQGQHRWIFNLWPPGMVHLYALIFQGGIPIGLTMFILTCVLYALVLTFLFLVVEKSFGRRIATTATLVGLLNPFAIASLSPASLLYSDGLGASFLALTAMSWLVWVPSLLSGVVGVQSSRYGLVFAISSVMVVSLRWAMVPVVAVFWLVAGAVALANRLVRKKAKEGRGQGSIFEYLKASVVATTMALPWTIYVATVLHPPSASWSVGGGYQWMHRWLFDEDLPNFLVSGNANWACDLDPEKCEVLRPLAIEGELGHGIFRDEAVITAMNYPLGFLLAGFSDFFRGFFSAPHSGVGSFSLWYLAAISALLILVAVAITTWRKNWLGLTSAAIVIVPTFFVITTFHIESRYLLPIHYYAFTVCVYLIFVGLRSRIRPKEVAMR